MTVRTLDPADLPAVRALQGHLAYADPDVVEAAAEGPFVGLVAAEAGDVVGYAAALPGREATLSELVVAPAFRRRGHGRALVEATAERTGADRLLVTTPAGDDAAVGFYRALGFEPDERIPGFYADGTDALRLARRE